MRTPFYIILHISFSPLLFSIHTHTKQNTHFYISIELTECHCLFCCCATWLPDNRIELMRLKETRINRISNGVIEATNIMKIWGNNLTFYRIVGSDLRFDFIVLFWFSVWVLVFTLISTGSIMIFNKPWMKERLHLTIQRSLIQIISNREKNLKSNNRLKEATWMLPQCDPIGIWLNPWYKGAKPKIVMSKFWSHY